MVEIKPGSNLIIMYYNITANLNFKMKKKKNQKLCRYKKNVNDTKMKFHDQCCMFDFVCYTWPSASFCSENRVILVVYP